jgi:dihydrofolate synthase/folylpolyglutamate synthase
VADAHPLLLDELFEGALETNVRWGLDRTRSMLDAVGNPQLRFRSLHVGGTNGKGSVAAMLDSVLRAAGHRVGLYTSPHLCRFNERIRVDGQALPDESLRALASELVRSVKEAGPSYFEAATALAFLAFGRAGVDAVVAEVGLGGRLDSTNVLVPDVTVITNVDLDHVGLLGDSREAIAAEKAGIIKEGIPVVTAEREPGALSVIEGVAHDLNAPLTVVTIEEMEQLEVDALGSRFIVGTRTWGRVHVTVPLAGRHQALNALLAVRALDALEPPLHPSAKAVRDGLEAVRWPGRLQRFSIEGVDWVFDVAHNPAGVAALVEAFRDLEVRRPVTALVGVLSDKDWRSMLERLIPHVDQVILTTPLSASPGRRWDPVSAAQWARRRFRGVKVSVCRHLEPAVAAAKATSSGSVVVTGSSYTVGDVLLELGIPPD